MITVTLDPEIGALSFSDLQEVANWVKEEKAHWQWMHELSKPGQQAWAEAREKVRTWFGDLWDYLDRFASGPSAACSGEPSEQLAQIQAFIEKHMGGGRGIHRNSWRAILVNQVTHKDPWLALHLLHYYILHAVQPNIPYQMEAAVRAFIYKSGIDQLSKAATAIPFVNPGRLHELQEIKKTQTFDLSRLIQYCVELNRAFDNDCYFAVALLTRAILNHVPPIFGNQNFDQIANNMRLGKSVKQSFQHLQNSLRPIADAGTHSPVRPSEVLPTATQINFSQDLDVLLGEIVRRLRTN